MRGTGRGGVPRLEERPREGGSTEVGLLEPVEVRFPFPFLSLFSTPPLTTSSPPTADAPTRRPLNLAARTTSSAESTPSSSPAPSSKASPFGAARPVDNAARDREVEEKLVKQREEAAKEKEAKIAAAKAAAEAAPKVETAAGKEGAGAKKNVQEPSRSEGAWERRGPLPEKEKREHRQAGAGKLPPPVPTVATASKDAPPHQPAAAKKEQGNFSFANSAAALEEATL